MTLQPAELAVAPVARRVTPTPRTDDAPSLAVPVERGAVRRARARAKHAAAASVVNVGLDEADEHTAGL